MNHECAQLFSGSRWLMEPRAFRALIARAATVTPEAIQAAMHGPSSHDMGLKMIGDVAVIDACGPITYRPSWFSRLFGMCTIEDMQMQFRMALADPAVKTIAFRWDSLGGIVDMVPEFADEVFAARGQKPILSIADTAMCSAAYWIACQADTIYATRSAQVGSIGVYLEHADISDMMEREGVKITLISHGDHKVDGNMYERLSEEAHADLKAAVDEVGAEFDAAVARGRGVSKGVVLERFGQGKVFRGKKAVSLGLADKMGTFQQIVGKLTKRQGGMMAGANLNVQIAANTQELIANLKAGQELIANFNAVEKKRAEMVEPDDDGACPEGYEMQDDDMCHLMPPPEQETKAEAEPVPVEDPPPADTSADDDAIAVVIALGE